MDRWLVPNLHEKERHLVLASTSPYRRQLLQRLRIPFKTIDSKVDEEPYKHAGLQPFEMVRTLAEAKARAVSSHNLEALIVSGDQCAVLDGRVMGKPGSLDAAEKQLHALAGRTHELITALCVLDAASQHFNTAIDVHKMTMRPLSSGQIRQYVAIDRPVDCAGSYKLESLGVALFECVTGNDPTAIVGMPLMRLVSMLQEAGYDVFANASHTT